MSKKSGKKEKVSQQSAAEFFSEHQQIAGFDNPGKSLFTTIREFVENSLDAAESMHVLPRIELFVEEFSESHHNELNGILIGGSSSSNSKDSKGLQDNDGDEDNDAHSATASAVTGIKSSKKGSDKAGSSKEKEQMYYLIRCVDNGCGIPTENVGDMLGRVLSGSKHGIRQTRGKFGLGAKMALIWSKKSSGLPIRIRTAHSPSAAVVPAQVCTTVLDIDIYKNEPRILQQELEANREQWRGTEIAVTIGGNWAVYRSRVLQYFQQLAVITPYAQLAVDFKCHRDEKKSFRADFERRSVQMPPVAQEIDPHPKALNNITMSNLLQSSRSQTIEKFLSSELNGISRPVATRIAETIKVTGVSPRSLTPANVAALIQLLRDEKQIKPPSAQCLSPAGEYNMRLGVMKELKPRMVATFSDKPGAHEGHPFLVEAAVSLGGSQVREGVNVYRFANRIPLLFEAGADVVTQVANKRINWSSYHIDPRKDNIGVYVSIVSTKIPFKGTSKEYVGEDVTEMFQSVKRALQGCCQQLRVNLAKSLALREEQERRKNLVKYIPNISKSLFAVVEKIQEKRASLPSSSSSSSSSNKSTSSSSSSQSTASSAGNASIERVLRRIQDQALSQAVIEAHLNKAVDKFEEDAVTLSAAAAAEAEMGAAGSAAGGSVGKRKLFLLPDTRLWDYPVDGAVPNATVSGLGDSELQRADSIASFTRTATECSTSTSPASVRDVAYTSGLVGSSAINNGGAVVQQVIDLTAEPRSSVRKRARPILSSAGQPTPAKAMEGGGLGVIDMTMSDSQPDEGGDGADGAAASGTQRSDGSVPSVPVRLPTRGRLFAEEDTPGHREGRESIRDTPPPAPARWIALALSSTATTAVVTTTAASQQASQLSDINSASKPCCAPAAAVHGYMLLNY